MQPLSTEGIYRFILPAPALRPYFSSYYFFEVDAQNGHALDDFLHPEWASARYILGGEAHASLVGEELFRVPFASMTGPTSRAMHIVCRKARLAGIGILPLGWHKFTSADASLFANRNCELAATPAFDVFAQIGSDIAELDDPSAIAAVMDRHLLAVLQQPTEREADIAHVHAALADPEIADVAKLSKSTGLGIQALERLCRREFGFTPKKLLRRQRFLRSLAPRLLDPSLKWSKVLDGSYHDQAHFSRDFKEFMGVPPRVYLAMPRPISKAAVRARLEALGQPLQLLQGPQPNDG